MALRNMLVRVGADITGLRKGLKSAQKDVQFFGRNVTGSMKEIRGSIAGIATAIGAGFIIKTGVQDAMRYEALMTTLGEQMGASRKQFEEWQETVGNAYGYSRVQSAETANLLSLNFSKIASSQEDLVNKTTKMMEVAAVISNKRGMTMQEVSDRIRSAMNQEADGADELGVNVRIASVKMSQAYQEMADGQPWDKMTENMRKTILYHHILEQVSDRLGTTMQDTTSLRMASFTASLADLRMALGQAFLPILYTVLPILTRFAQSLYRALQMVSSFMRVVFGGGFKYTQPEIKQGTEAIKEQTGALGSLGDSAEDAGKKSVASARKAKKAWTGIFGFDEVNTIKDPEEPTAGGGGGGGGGGGSGLPALEGMDELLPDENKTTGFFDKISESAQKAGEAFRKFFGESTGWASIKTGLGDVWTGLQAIWNTKFVQFMVADIMAYLPTLFNNMMLIVGGTLSTIGGLLKIFAGIFDNDIVMRFQGFGDIINGVFDIISGIIGAFFPKIGEKLQEWHEGFEQAWDDFVDEFVESGDTAMDVWEKVLKDWFEKYKTFFFELGVKNRENWEQMKKDAKKNIDEWVNDGVTKFMDFRTRARKQLREFEKEHGSVFEGVKKIMKQKMEEAWIEFKKPFVDSYNWFKKNLIDPLTRAFKNISSAFDISFGAGIKAVYNTAVDFLNGMIRDFNKISIAGFSPNINTIPRLAQGGITNGPTLAMVGDNAGGREVISPLDKLQGMLTNSVIQAMQLGGGGNQATGDIILNIDGRSFARIVKPFLDKEQNRIGNDVRIRSI